MVDGSKVESAEAAKTVNKYAIAIATTTELTSSCINAIKKQCGSNSRKDTDGERKKEKEKEANRNFHDLTSILIVNVHN